MDGVVRIDVRGLAVHVLDDLLVLLADASDPAVRMVVLTGLGAVESPPADLTDPGPLEVANQVVAVQDEVARLGCPVVALLDGRVGGVGLQVALACDLLVAVEGAVLDLTPPSVATYDGGRSTRLLEDAVGRARAALWFHTASEVPATVARDSGLVAVVSPASGVDDLLDRIAERVRATSPLSQRLLKGGRLAGMPRVPADARQAREQALSGLRTPVTDDGSRRTLAEFAISTLTGIGTVLVGSPSDTPRRTTSTGGNGAPAAGRPATSPEARREPDVDRGPATEPDRSGPPPPPAEAVGADGPPPPSTSRSSRSSGSGGRGAPNGVDRDSTTAPGAEGEGGGGPRSLPRDEDAGGVDSGGVDFGGVGSSGVGSSGDREVEGGTAPA